jgi:ABC-type phosphate/phosphonate transport system substrate-binding protein
MPWFNLFPWQGLRPAYLAWAIVGLLVSAGGPVLGQADKTKRGVLSIGTSGTLGGTGSRSDDRAALKKLRSFIKEETGLDNEIIDQKDWRQLAERMAKRKFQLGVFQGEEYAWARAKYPELQPLALTINVDRYPVAHVVTRRSNRARDFAGLKGASLVLPSDGQRFLRTFLEQQCKKTSGTTAARFFSQIKHQENIEDALDDVVDGVVQAAVADRASLMAYKRRKPGRFKQLKEVGHSQPFPPPIIAFYDKGLDQATRQRFLDGLLGARRKERGRSMLTMFRLTGFEKVPSDFDQVVARTQKNYPPPREDEK